MFQNKKLWIRSVFTDLFSRSGKFAFFVVLLLMITSSVFKCITVMNRSDSPQKITLGNIHTITCINDNEKVRFGGLCPGHGDTLLTRDKATITIPLSTSTVFINGRIRLNTMPNELYRIFIKTGDNPPVIVDEDTFFENFSLDITSWVKNQSDVILIIEEEKKQNAAAIIDLEITLERISKYYFLLQVIISLVVLLMAMILNVGIPSHLFRYFIFNMVLFSVVLIFFPIGLPHFFLINLALCIFWSVTGAGYRICRHNHLPQCRSLSTITRLVENADTSDGLELFLLIVGLILVLMMIPFFRLFGLNRIEGILSPPAPLILKLMMGSVLLTSLLVLLPLNIFVNNGKKSLTIRWNRDVFYRLMIWGPIAVSAFLFFHFGVNYILANFNHISPDTPSYFGNTKRSWFQFFLPTGYRPPLLSYLNKFFYGLLDMPSDDILFMKITTLYFYMCSFLITVALIRRLFRGNWAAVFGAIVMIAYFCFDTPIIFLKQAIRLYPYIFLYATSFYLILRLWDAQTRFFLTLFSVLLGMVMACTCLLRPENMYVFPGIVIVGVVLSYRKVKYWILTVIVVILLYGPYHYLKENQSSEISDFDLGGVGWRNVEFINEVGLRVHKDGAYSGPPISMWEYFFKLHTPFEVFAYTVGGYYRTLFSGNGSYFKLEIFVNPGGLLNRKTLDFIGTYKMLFMETVSYLKLKIINNFIMYIKTSYIKFMILLVLLMLNILTIIGFLSINNAKFIMVIAYIFSGLIPNAFMNHLGSSARHYYHVWPFMVTLTVLGIITLIQAFFKVQDFYQSKRAMVFYTVFLIIFLLPGLYPDVMTLNRLNVGVNRYKNYVRGERFQKYYSLEKTVENKPHEYHVSHALFPKGEGFIGFRVNNPVKGAAVIKAFDQTLEIEFEIVNTIPSNEPLQNIRIPFYTDRVVSSDIFISFSGIPTELIPTYIKISSLPENLPEAKYIFRITSPITRLEAW